MRKLIFTIAMLAFTIIAAAQETPRYSLNFNETPIVDALLSIEQTSGIKFYYDPQWFAKNPIKVSGNFTDKTADEIISALLQKTDLNFYHNGSSIILVKNSMIQSELPDNFFKPGEAAAATEPDEPVFQKAYSEEPAVLRSDAQAVTLIGKQSRNKTDTKFMLSGYVKDMKTGEALAGVNVRVAKLKIGTLTDANGHYTIELPSGTTTIETFSASHQPVTRKIVLYDNGILNLRLTEIVNVLDEVIVNSKARDNLKSAVTGVIALDVEGIKNIPLVLGERDIFKVATTLPGIKTAGEGSAGFNVRGGKEDQNLILLDNALLYNPSHFFGFFSAVNPYTVDKANIYKGSIPAEYGGRLSSVFDISTKAGSTSKFSGEGGIGPVTSNLTMGIPIVKDKASLLVGGRGTYSGWILRSLNEPELKNSKASFYDAIVKYSHKINQKNDIESTFYYSHDAFSITSDSLYSYSNRLFSLKWDHTFNDKNKGSLIVTNSDYKFNIDYDSQNQNTNSFEFGYNLNETQVQAKMTYAYNAKHKISYGFASKLYNIDPGHFDPKSAESLLVDIQVDKERGLESAVYLADSFKISDKLLLDAGIRYSVFAFLGETSQRVYEANVPLNDATVVDVRQYGKNEVAKSYGGFEPRVAARYFLTHDFSVKASYDRTYQYIHLLSNNTTQSPTDTWKLSDLNVKPQRAEQFSLGLYKNLKDNTFELSLEGYYKKSENFLDYKVGAELLLNRDIETELLQGQGKAYGVELLLKKPDGKLNGWIGYTYSRTFVKLDSKFGEERVNNGNYFPANFDKPHDLSVVLNYKFTQRYSLSTNFIYQTGRPITYPIGSYQYSGVEYTLYSDRNQFRIPDYFRLDVGVNIEGNHKIKKLAHSFWNISVYNVLGRNNPYSVYFVTETGQIKAYQTSIFSIPVPTITYNFKF